MQTIKAKEIKRRGIGAADEGLANGPVHVIQNDKLAYVILSEAQYQELLEDRDQAYRERLRAALEDMREGRVTPSTAPDMVREFGLLD